MNGNHFDPATSERIVEQLRYGVPPPDHVRAFTVGREEQLRELQETLETPETDRGAALLIKANYGAGKTHLLEVVREIALDAGYAVSLVTVNAQEGVRFNRMDTILGAVTERVEVDSSGAHGIGTLFDAFADAPRSTAKDIRQARDRISSTGKWDYSDYLKSAAMYVALRAWIATDKRSDKDLITDWLAHPENYRGQRKLLYSRLVAGLRTRFRDPRAEWQFYADEVFTFHTGGHRQAWDALADMNLLARLAGHRGLILLFDEFEDVIQNLNRKNLQQQAFLNLFRFFAGDRYPGMSYFAVTPDFVSKCKVELLRKGVYDFDYAVFDQLPAFEMDEITHNDFLLLADKVRQVHGVAYEWPAAEEFDDAQLKTVVEELWSVSSPDRVRRAIGGLVKALDERLEDGE